MGRPDQFHFLRPPKLVLEGALYGTFSHRQSYDTFPPPFAVPNFSDKFSNTIASRALALEECFSKKQGLEGGSGAPGPSTSSGQESLPSSAISTSTQKRPVTGLDFFEKKTSEISRRGHWKRGICRKSSEIDFRICDNFAQPSCDVRNEIAIILPKFGAQFATNLRNTPLANAPFSGFLEKEKRVLKKHHLKYPSK